MDPHEPPDEPHPTIPLPGNDIVPAGSIGGEPMLAQIGEIQVTATAVRTPGGQVPLRGTSWDVTEQWQTRQKTATWGIAVGVSLAVVLFLLGFVSCFTFCLAPFALLFLLAKDTVYDGVALVSVRSGGFQYVARVPVYNQAQVQHVYNQVNYVRAVALS
jgi:hypothetical protein